MENLKEVVLLITPLLSLGVSLVAIIISSKITFRVAKFNVERPEFIRKKQKQFDEVYCPIESLLRFKKIPKLQTNEIIVLLENIEKLFEANFAYTSPNLVDDCSWLLEKIKKKKGIYYLQKIQLQHFVNRIQAECQMLREELGYPTGVIPFRKKSTTGQFISMVSWLLILFPIYTLVILIYIIAILIRNIHPSAPYFIAILSISSIYLFITFFNQLNANKNIY